MYGRRLDEPRLTAWWAIEGRRARTTSRPPVLGELWAELWPLVRPPVRLAGREPLPRRSRQRRLARRPHRSRHARAGRGHREPRRARRPFLLRPQGGGPSRALLPGDGDLLVMGGPMPARLGARRAEGGVGRRAPAQPHVPPWQSRAARAGSGQIRSDAEPLRTASDRHATAKLLARGLRETGPRTSHRRSNDDRRDRVGWGGGCRSGHGGARRQHRSSPTFVDR